MKLRRILLEGEGWPDAQEVQMSDQTRAELFRAEDGWRFRLRSKANGEVVAQSEGYVRLEDCRHEAEQLVGEDDVEVLD